jgi:hypothetical protein
MAEGLAELAAIGRRLEGNLSRLNRDAGHRVGKAGNDEVRKQASVVFGPDHKFSGARGSKTAGRKATVRYRVEKDQVHVDPGGDPWYIFIKGRGRHVIRPRRGKKKSGLRLPDGEVRRSVVGGRMAPRPQVLDPVVPRIANKAARAYSEAVNAAITRSLR